MTSAIPDDPRRATKLVMCVDDSALIRGLIVRAVAQAGYRTATCASGAECLAQLRTTEPDIVLLDVDMPEMSGFDTLEEIRKRDTKLAARVIMLTASRTKVAVDEARLLGADDYIIKTMDPARLIERIDFWAGLKTFGQLEKGE